MRLVFQICAIICFIIGLKLFGAAYSGLEYDYRGLCHVYECLDDAAKYLEYSQSLATWRLLREGNRQGNVSKFIKFMYISFKIDKI